MSFVYIPVLHSLMFSFVSYAIFMAMIIPVLDRT